MSRQEPLENPGDERLVPGIRKDRKKKREYSLKKDAYVSHCLSKDRTSEHERSQVISTVATGRAPGDNMRLNQRIQGWSW